MGDQHGQVEITFGEQTMQRLGACAAWRKDCGAKLVRACATVKEA